MEIENENENEKPNPSIDETVEEESNSMELESKSEGKDPAKPPKREKKTVLVLCSELPRFSYRDLFAKRQEVSSKDPSGGVSSSEKPGKPGKPGTRQVKKVVEVTDEDGFTRGNGRKCAL